MSWPRVLQPSVREPARQTVANDVRQLDANRDAPYGGSRRTPGAARPRGGVVTQRTANPCTPVRFRARPPAPIARPADPAARCYRLNRAKTAPRTDGLGHERRFLRTQGKDGRWPGAHHRRDRSRHHRRDAGDCRAKPSSTRRAARSPISTRTSIPIARPGALSDGAVAVRQAGAACRHPPRRNRSRCRLRHRLFGGRAVATGRPVVALESDAALAERRGRLLPGMAADNVAVVTGPLAAGHAEAAPYDVIILGGSGRGPAGRRCSPAQRGRPPGRGRGPGQCRRCAPLFQIGGHRDRPARLQCGSKATTRLRTYAGVRSSRMVSLVMRGAHVHVGLRSDNYC